MTTQSPEEIAIEILVKQNISPFRYCITKLAENSPIENTIDVEQLRKDISQAIGQERASKPTITWEMIEPLFPNGELLESWGDEIVESGVLNGHELFSRLRDHLKKQCESTNE